MAVPNQWAIREVANATFYNVTTGKAIVQLTNLKTSGLENMSEVVYVRGGRGNPKLIGFSSNREAKITLQDAVFTNEVIAMLTGSNFTTAATPVYVKEVLTVATNSVTLKNTPIGAATASLISIYKENADGTHGAEITHDTTLAAGKYTRNAKTVTFDAADALNTTKVIVYYQTNTSATAKKISIQADKFAGSFLVVLDCVVRDNFTKTDAYGQAVINSAKLEDNWKIEMSSTGDPAVLDITLDVLKPANSTEMYTLTVYDELSA